MVKRAEKSLKALDTPIKKRIEGFLNQLECSLDPRLMGKPLQGNLKGMWRYRVGDYRLICEIKDQQVVILVVDIGHRKEIYH